MQSDNLDKLLPALLKAQSEIVAVKKSAVNPFFKSKYADLSSVQAAVQEPLQKNGLVIVQGCGVSNYGNFVFTTLYHESGQFLRSETPMILSKQDPQGVGSAVTYFRRYGIVSMLNLEQEDDDGNGAIKHDPRESAENNGQKPDAHSTQKAGKQRADEIAALAKAGYIKKEVWQASLKACNVKGLTDLPKDEAQMLINHGLDNKTLAEQGA